MSKAIIVLGAGGHGRVIADIIRSSGDKLAGFLDDNVTGEIRGVPVLGRLEDVSGYKDSYSFVIGIGDNTLRKHFSELYHADWHTAIHPSAILASDVVIGAGSVVMAGAIVNTGTRIGAHCIINTGAVVEHDSQLGDFVHISPNATLCGMVEVGHLTHIGAGAVVRNNTIIIDKCTIGAGSVVIREVSETGVYAGNPVMKIK